MALLRVYQSIDNDVWKLNFVNDPNQLSEGDKKAMRQYGEPEIEMGGTFLDNTINEFTLPLKKVRVRSDLPYTEEFDSRDELFETNTQVKVLAYRDEIVSRFTSAFTTLRAISDTFSGEQTYNI